MGKEFIRMWIEEDVEEVARHLLMVGESFGNCGNCRQLGLDFTNVRECPKCKTAFKYVTSRFAGSGTGERYHWLRKIKAKRPELSLIDYDDYHRNRGRIRARDLLK